MRAALLLAAVLAACGDDDGRADAAGDGAPSGDGRPDARVDGDGAPLPDGMVPPDTLPLPDQRPLPDLVPPPFDAPPVPDAFVAPDTPPLPPAGDCTGVGVSPAILCVDDGAAPGGDGTAAAPFDSVQAAVDAAQSGDTLQIAGGSYAENVTVSGIELALLGGFPGGGDFSSRDPAAHPTHLQGVGDAPTLELLTAGGSVVDGLRLTGGRGRYDGFGRWEGGGVYAEDSQVVLARSTIEDNDARHGADFARGGGVAVSGGSATIVDCLVRGNRASRGAGIAVSADLAAVRGTRVEDNLADGDHGGGLFLDGPAIEVSDSRVTGNAIGVGLGYGWGGGVYVHGEGSALTLARTVVTGNEAPSIGGGVFVDNGASALLVNVEVYANGCPTQGGSAVYVDGIDAIGSRATIVTSTLADSCPLFSVDEESGRNGGNGVYVEGSSLAVVTSSILWGNGDDFYVDGSSALFVDYTLSAEGWPGAGNLYADPLFADPLAGDYHLRSLNGRWHPGSSTFVLDAVHSPAIDAGDPAAPWSRESAPNGGRVNMGSHGNTPEASRSP